MVLRTTRQQCATGNEPKKLQWVNAGAAVSSLSSPESAVHFEGSILHLILDTFICSCLVVGRIVEKFGLEFRPCKETLGTDENTSKPFVGRGRLSFGETWRKVSLVEFVLYISNCC